MTRDDVTRRDLLKSGCALAAGIAAPYVITSSALGNEKIAPASDRVTLGCIGVGDAEAAKMMRRPMRAPWTL